MMSEPISQYNRELDLKQAEGEARRKEVRELANQFIGDPGTLRQFMGDEMDHVTALHLHEMLKNKDYVHAGFLLEKAFEAYCESEAERMT